MVTGANRATHFKNDFDKWTSGNFTIDKFQDTQLNADYFGRVIEWIPYDRFQDIKQIAKSGYSTVYYAKWGQSREFSEIHKLDIVHLHPGNILKYDLGSNPGISIDFGLNLAFNICNGFRPKISFHTLKLITQIIMRCWDARITHRPTFDELWRELEKYWEDYRENDNNNNEITIQIKEAEEFSKNQTTDTTTTIPTNYKTNPRAIYTSRILNFSNLPRPKNDENFEREFEELTESFYQINARKSRILFQKGNKEFHDEVILSNCP
ncbi:hypothetical protein Glove_420g80 [Diversispora epigaea]|uniref:Serine-threonine/tyrosine-protein kinase catalytic domain-containing protein n=1 Tax=Diversispora epigaea TaxID=1348612 RepID=A0A397GVR8_9GLOM|nr:hypothetical protein Glove_420g80 [Diversispora epigaea]